MLESAGAKFGIFSLLGVLLWIDANLGLAFYVMIAAYMVHFALQYQNKQAFIQKMFLYLGSAFFAYYLQNTADFMSIPLLHGLIIGLAAHEVLEVLIELKTRLDVYKVVHPNDAATIDSAEALLAQVQSLLPSLLAMQNAAGAAPVVPVVPVVPTPPTV